MERFQGLINPYYLDQNLDVSSLEVQRFAEAQSFALKEEEESLRDSIPFLQMLQSEDPNFLKLLSLQTFREPWEIESYLSHENNTEFHPMEGANQALSNQELPLSQANMRILPSSSSSSPGTANSRRKRKISQLVVPEMNRGKRKRRKTKPSKNIEEIENQRMNHIAVERNRRRQMNEHINSLRSLLPPSYIQRGDQASIVGGAINYVKVLEQIIQSLESKKRMQLKNGNNHQEATNNHLLGISSNNLWTNHEDEACIPKIEATMIQDHVNLKVECLKKQEQLIKGIISLEKLGLTVLHLNVASSSHSSVSYSFNLKMEDDCDLASADEIIAAAHQIFDVRH